MTYIAIILSLATVISYLNHRFFKLHASIAIMAAGILLSLILLILNATGLPVMHHQAVAFMQAIDFHALVMNFMLAFLLFAGAMSIDVSHFWSQKYEITLLSMGSTLASTFLVAGLLFTAFSLLKTPLSFAYCLVFGSLISPTDPIAVLAIFKKLEASKSLETLIASESLFNDGIGVVLFTTACYVAFTGQATSTPTVLSLFFTQAIGGIIYGLFLGWIAHFLIRSANQRHINLFITLSMVTGAYTLAQNLGISGPLAMVVAGIMLTNYRPEKIPAAQIQDLRHFWELIDELLNMVLFLLLGFEILLIPYHAHELLMSLWIIPLVLFARWATVFLPLHLIAIFRPLHKAAVSILTWGGLRGGLAVALALALPTGTARATILPLTYAVVAFSILIQGTTMPALIRKSKR